MARDDLRGDLVPRVKVPNNQLVPGVDADKVIYAELYVLECSGTRRLKDLLHAPLAKDVDLASAKFALPGGYSQKRLNGTISEAASREQRMSASQCVFYIFSFLDDREIFTSWKVPAGTDDTTWEH